jgi:TonB family protein
MAVIEKGEPDCEYPHGLGPMWYASVSLRPILPIGSSLQEVSMTKSDIPPGQNRIPFYRRRWFNLLMIVASLGTIGAAFERPIPPEALTSHVMTAEDYPPVSIREQEEGTVNISYVVGLNGTVTSCMIEESSGKPRLDGAACAAVMAKWRFKPATQYGQPVQMRLRASVHFELRNACEGQGFFDRLLNLFCN